MTDHSFFINPVLPLEFLAGLGVLVVVLGGLHLWKAPGLSAVLRPLGAMILLFSLLNIEISTQKTTPVQDVLFAVIDNSSSQNIGTRRTQTETALQHLQSEVARHPDLDLRVIPVPADHREDREGTRLGAALKQGISGLDPQRFAGAVFISDGQSHDLETLSAQPGPLHVLLSGSRRDHDLRIEILDAPKYALVDAPYRIKVRVLENGEPAPSAPLNVTLPDGQTLDVPAALSSDGVRTVTTRLSKSGAALSVFETPVSPEEVSQQNNRIAVSVNGIRDRLRVLLVSGMPHQGQRTWRNLLRSDPSVDLVHFTILRPSEKEDFTPLNELSLIAFPVRELFEEKLRDFDLIIFDRYFQRSVLDVSAFENIREYLKDGGAVLISAGPDFSGPLSLAATPLGDIMPALPTGGLKDQRPFRLQRPETGQRHPVTSRLGSSEQDWGRWTRLIDVEHYRGQTLLESQTGEPVLIVDRVEEGRIALMLSDHLWLWARGFDGGGPHRNLVRHLVHWLMKEPDLEEEKLSLHSLENGQLEVIRQSLEAVEASVELTFPDGETRMLKLNQIGNGQARAVIDAAPAGLYSAHQEHLSTMTTHGAVNPLELSDPRASEVAFQALINQTGGSLHWIEDGLPRLEHVSGELSGRVMNRLQVKQNNASLLHGVERTSLLEPWVVFVLISAMIGLIWWRESR